LSKSPYAVPLLDYPRRRSLVLIFFSRPGIKPLSHSQCLRRHQSGADAPNQRSFSPERFLLCVHQPSTNNETAARSQEKTCLLFRFRSSTLFLFPPLTPTLLLGFLSFVFLSPNERPRLLGTLSSGSQDNLLPFPAFLSRGLQASPSFPHSHGAVGDIHSDQPARQRLRADLPFLFPVLHKGRTFSVRSCPTHTLPPHV